MLRLTFLLHIEEIQGLKVILIGIVEDAQELE